MNSPNSHIFSNKSNYLCEIGFSKYKQVLNNNIDTIWNYNDISTKATDITMKIRLDNQAKQEAYITIKDPNYDFNIKALNID